MTGFPVVDSKIEPEPITGCWLWIGARHQHGYGIMQDHTPRRRRLYAHRVMYEALRGPIPRGMTLDHLCRQRCCVNPVHLEAVSRVENVRRGAARSGVMYQAPNTCKRGHLRRDHYDGQGRCRLCREITETLKEEQELQR